MNKLLSAIFLSSCFLFPKTSYAFEPKVVCLDDTLKFLGWLTSKECHDANGQSPSDFSLKKSEITKVKK